MSDQITEIKKLLEQENLVIGNDKTIKGLRENTLSKVFLAANCPEDKKETIMHYASLLDVEVVNLEISNEELGDICKKPFFILVMGVLKQ